ncbi:MAG: threonine/serine exporter family protein [Anaerolineae bacterium]
MIDLALWAGQLLLQHGAEATRIEETVHHIGTGLGADWMDILVSPNAIIATTSSGGEFRTKVRRVTRMGVNFSIVDEVNDLSHRVFAGELDRFHLRQELHRVSDLPPVYGRWQVVGMVGLGCAAFSRLFGADWPVMLVTFSASAVAMWVRQELTRRHFNNLLIVVITSFVAGCIASLATVYNIGEEPQFALAASVLLLVPGVPLINAAEDLIEGHVLAGVARGVIGAVIALGIAVGLSLALRLMGVQFE